VRPPRLLTTQGCHARVSDPAAHTREVESGLANMTAPQEAHVSKGSRAMNSTSFPSFDNGSAIETGDESPSHDFSHAF
jgi:hypothetical protein